MTDRARAGDPPWLVAAFNDVGLHEIDGPRSSPRIIEMYRAAGVPHPETKDDSKLSWCSAAMNFWFAVSGLRGTGSLAGRSWFGRGPRLDDSQTLPRGAIAMFKYDDDPNHAHVCIVLRDRGGMIDEIGANQGNAVNERSWHRESLIGAVWPDDYPMHQPQPDVPLPPPRPDIDEGEPPALPQPPDVRPPAPLPQSAQPSLLRRIGNWLGGLFTSGGLFYMDWRLGLLLLGVIVLSIGFALWLFGREPIKAWILKHLGSTS